MLLEIRSGYYKGMLLELYHNYGLTKSFSWKEVGIHNRTLSAVASRGLLIKDGDKYRLTAKGILFATLERRSKEYMNLKRPNDNLGMMCRIKGADILDCYDNKWDYDENILILDTNNYTWNKIIFLKEENND